ncbi:MAG TPA: rod shape-determining protein MreC [Trinickia sp.]|uniref:rod shape-determining protein MreC n=1 Tax=Trinickia sp. TaxID=2571163 RepID=UPI002BE466A9|nr:rod shape-determining protein MreC [Trinickia sp.]HTI17213.1 rod shape-determining protein MreC [Trinickia sp.]
MEYSPPPLFKQGPSAFARLVFFVVLALALLVSDAHFKTLEMLRAVLDIGLYPLQRAALVPRDVVLDGVNLVMSSTTLQRDNNQLAARNRQLSVEANRSAALAAENTHLRALISLSQQVAVRTTPAEVQYDMRDPFTQKVVIGAGSQEGIQNGSPVVSEDGMVGQITRVYPMQSEVTLLTDKDQAVPVQVVRTGLRGVVYGMPAGNTLELRFVPITADIVAGDELVTSGLDGVYPPGLPVAKVVRVDKLADTAFARVIGVPVAAVRGTRDVLVIHYDSGMPPRPEPQPDPVSPKDAKGKKPTKAAEKNTASESGDKGPGSAEKGPLQAGGKPAQASPAQQPAQQPEQKPVAKAAANATATQQAAVAPRTASGATR